MSQKYGLVVLAVLAVGLLQPAPILGDYYTAITDLKKLLKAEEVLLLKLEQFYKVQEAQSKQILRFLHRSEEYGRNFRSEMAVHFGNPLSAFQTIRRYVRDWAYITAYFTDPGFNQAYVDFNNTVESTKTSVSQIDDILGAAQGVARLQKFYKLKTEDLASGILLNVSTRSNMPVSDCFHLGWYLGQAKEYSLGLSWLLEAHRRLHSVSQEERTFEWDGVPLLETKIEDIASESAHFPYTNDDVIMQSIIHMLYHSKNWRMARYFIESELAKNPNNEQLRSFHEAITSETKEQRIPMDILGAQSEPTVSVPNELESLDVDDTFEKTCRGELRQDPAVKRTLSCRYTHNDIPFRRIAPFKFEQLNLDPYIAIVYDAIFDTEIDFLRNESTSELYRSLAGGEVTEVRTSKNSWHWWGKHNATSRLAQRLEDITGLTLSTGEPMQVANYGIGGHYMAHTDYLEENDVTDTYSEWGPRLMTAMFYLNHVELGGATAFPTLRLAVSPIRGALVFWYNLHRNGIPDYRTLHGGCPVLKGSKWIGNEWFRMFGQMFRRPCGLHVNSLWSTKETSCRRMGCLSRLI